MNEADSSRARKIEVILNAHAGTSIGLNPDELLERIRTNLGDGVQVRTVVDGSTVADLAKAAAEGDAEVVVAAGGDGTISGVASAVVDSGKVLGVIPLGTFNFFAKRLGIPLDLEDAARTIAHGATTSVNVGEVNGRVFLNKSSVGLYPLAVRYREKMYKRFGRNQLVAVSAGAAALLRRGRVMRLTLVTDAEEHHFQTRFVFVCNNPQELEKFDVRGRECLEHDRLAVYLPEPLTPFQMAGLGVRMMFGRLREAEGYNALCAREVRLETRRSRLPVSIDGEVEMMQTPLRYCLRARALRVLVPAGTQ